jgi:uncharacterized phage-associated protein
MIINHQKEKAFNAITYFLNHTTICNKKKLFKLLYLLDFEHFEQIGRSVTGYNYFAWKMGPVPKELHIAMEANEGKFAENFDVIKERDKGGYERIKLVNKKPFDSKYFSRRELALLKDISLRFEMMTGQEMEDFTHRQGMPWHHVWVEEKKENAEIPYEYALNNLDSDERDTILVISEERKAVLENYQ